MKVLLVDTETTGLKRDIDYVISIGAVIYDTKRKEIIDKFYSVLDWTKVTDKILIEEYITNINGFTLEKLKEEGIHPVEALDDFYDFIVNRTSEVQIISAFNLPFDLGMLKSNSLTFNHKLFNLLNKKDDKLKNLTLFDSCHYDRMFHSGFNPDGTVIRHSMAAVGERYQIEDEGMAHNALDDVIHLSKIFSIQFQEIKKKLNRKINSKFEEEMSINYSTWKYAENQSFYAEEVKGIEL